MTFGSMNEVTSPATTGSYPVLPASTPVNPALAPEPQAPANEVIVKAFFGSDIRRASFSGGYAPLHEVLTKVYGIDPATIVLKYQDEEGDKITMSTDVELQEALKLAKDKVLRVYVETKSAPVPPQEEPWGNGNRWRHGPMRGHRGGGFGFGGRRGGGGFHHGPFPHPHPPFVGGHPHPPHGDFPHPPHAHPADPVQTAQHDQQQQDGSSANYSTARMYAHGFFSPADAMARARADPYPRCDWKERKNSMKEHMKYMKENNGMGKDEFKEIKQMMKYQMNFDKDEFKAAKRAAKQEKKDKKDKREKKEKKEKKGKDERFVARHVSDVSIPDNSELPANTPATKTWRLRNDGALAWPADSQLIFVSKRGDDLNGPERVHVGAVESQKEVDVSVTFVTPIEPGRYTGYYRMATGEGRKFGQRVWVSFIVAQPIGAVPVANAGAAIDRVLDVNME